MRTRLSCCVAAIALVLGLTAGAQAPNRAEPPQPGPVPAFRPPAVQKRTLSNGLPVWVVELHKVPVVQVSLVVRGGADADPQGKYGVASLTAAMLDEGAGNRTALQIADALDYLGASLNTSSGFDSANVSLWIPSARLSDALPIMADIALRPTFPTDELERLRKERLTSLLQARDDPASIAEMAFPRLLYGASKRYGVPTGGTPETIRSFTPADLRGFYGEWYRPANAALIVVGDVKPDAVLPTLESSFGSWKTGQSGEAEAASAPASPVAATTEPRRVFIVDKPGAAQSQIRIGRVGVARSTPDYFPIEVMNTILGGSFTSRLNQNLREQHGYTYGAGSGFVMRFRPGPFFAAAGVETDKTADALKEFFNEFEGILKPVPPQELARAKNYVALGFPSEFETTASISGRLAELWLYRLPDDYFANYIPRILAVTAADVEQVAKKYINPTGFLVVVVGDRKVVEPGIAALKLGPVEVLSVTQALGPQ
ncbi:MAG: M16 family metallopeptidase [Bacteroidales bacterium]